jgi:hypothetical protein
MKLGSVLSWLVLLSIIISSRTLRAESPPKSANELIARNYQARGGYKAIKAIRSLRMIGTLEDSGQKMQFRVEKMRPNFLRVTWTMNGMSGGEGYDDASWELASNGKVTRTQGTPSNATRHAAEFDDFFVDYMERKIQVRFLGMQRLDRQDLYGLQATLPDGFSKCFYFDPITFLVVATRVQAPVHARGPDRDLVAFAEDYRRVQNVLFPFSGKEEDLKSGKVMSRSQWDRIEVNAHFDPSYFLPPAQ